MTKRFQLILLAVAMCVLPAVAGGNDDIKLWSEGPLAWSDFHQLLPPTSSEASRLEVELSATPMENGGNATSSVRLEARAIMHRNASATSTAQSTPERLRYHQLQFDLLELMRRNLQEEINTGIDGATVERRLKHYQDLYYQRARQIAQETKNGTLEAAVASWEDNIEKQLLDVGTPQVPHVTAMQGCYGVYAGVGYDSPTGSLRDNFGGSFMFHVGLTGGFKRLRFKTDVAFGQPSYRNDNIFNVAPDAEGRPLQGNSSSNATHIMASVQLGYTIVNHNRLSITPNVGGFYNRYNWEVANYSWDKDDDGNDVEAANFYMVYNNPGMGISGSGPHYNFNYSSNITGQVANADVTGVILAGSTDDSLLTLHPGCCILRFPADETMDYVYVGFTANTIPKSGDIAIGDDGAVTITGSNYLAGVSSENAGEYLQMHTDGGVDAYYVAVPIKGSGVSTQLFFKWKYSASSDIYKFKTSGRVTLQKGYVYTVGKTRVSPFDVDGASNSLFMVSSSSVVRFSSGNLQAKKPLAWRFAPNQYDAVGYNNGTIFDQLLNSNYFDLFGWATSGYNNGQTAYDPKSKSTTNSDYLEATTIAGTNSDWGRYAASSGYPIYYNGTVSSASWRVLTGAEWKYLIDNGTWGLATINGMYKGMVILPDAILINNGTDYAYWTTPDGCSFTSGKALGYNTNTYTLEQWAQMESAGAIFLPVTGYRNGIDVNDYNAVGYYWASDGSLTSKAYNLYFGYDEDDEAWYVTRNQTLHQIGYAVRLVSDYSL